MPKLIIITGLPGAGKSSVAKELVDSLEGNWTLLKADDFIGVTLSVFEKPWSQVRHFRPAYIGWSAEYYLANGFNVIVEGALINDIEINHLVNAAKEGAGGTLDYKVILLRADDKTLVKRLVNDPGRFIGTPDEEKEESAKYMVESRKIKISVPVIDIDVSKKSCKEVAKQVSESIEKWS